MEAVSLGKRTKDPQFVRDRLSLYHRMLKMKPAGDGDNHLWGLTDDCSAWRKQCHRETSKINPRALQRF